MQRNVLSFSLLFFYLSVSISISLSPSSFISRAQELSRAKTALTALRWRALCAFWLGLT